MNDNATEHCFVQLFTFSFSHTGCMFKSIVTFIMQNVNSTEYKDMQIQINQFPRQSDKRENEVKGKICTLPLASQILFQACMEMVMLLEEWWINYNFYILMIKKVDVFFICTVGNEKGLLLLWYRWRADDCREIIENGRYSSSRHGNTTRPSSLFSVFWYSKVWKLLAWWQWTQNYILEQSIKVL